MYDSNLDLGFMKGESETHRRVQNLAPEEASAEQPRIDLVVLLLYHQISTRPGCSEGRGVASTRQKRSPVHVGRGSPVHVKCGCLCTSKFPIIWNAGKSGAFCASKHNLCGDRVCVLAWNAGKVVFFSPSKCNPLRRSCVWMAWNAAQVVLFGLPSATLCGDRVWGWRGMLVKVVLFGLQMVENLYNLDGFQTWHQQAKHCLWKPSKTRHKATKAFQCY